MFRRTRHDYDTPSPEDLRNRIEAWLAKPQQLSIRNGFADVSSGDVEELDDLIRALVKYRYAPDPDGDRPILWSLLNWRTHEIPPFFLLPKDTRTNHDRRLKIAASNVNAASIQLNHVVKMQSIGRNQDA